MILVRSPLRISLGASDYNTFINSNGKGNALGFSINKYSYISARVLPKFFDYKSKFTYSEIETVDENLWVDHKGIWNTLKKLDMMNVPLEINHFSDLPTNSGLGSSSAFLVSLIYALYELHNAYIDDAKLLKLALEVERSYSVVGWQDAAFAIFGGAASFTFHKNEAFDRLPIRAFGREMEKYGLLFYLNQPRYSSHIVNSYVGKLGKDDNQKKIFDICEKATDMVMDDFSIEDLAMLVREAWVCKKKISKDITTPKVLYLEKTLKDKYLAYRLLGGGGGGSLFILAYPDRHETIIKWCEENNCVHIPFKVSPTGCEVVVRND